MKDLSDQQLVQKHLSSQHRGFAAFNEIVRRYEPKVFTFCLKYIRNHETAQELTQEVFVTAFNKLSKLNQPEKLKAWLFTIASNKCNDRYKKNKRQQELQDRVSKELAIEQQGNESLSNPLEEQIERLRYCLTSLKDTEKDILNLHYFSDLTVSEVAHYLDMSESAVKMRLSRARDKIQHKMQKIVTRSGRNRSKK